MPSLRTSPAPRRLFLAVLALAAASACASAPARGPESSGAKGEDEKDEDQEIEELTRKLELAKLELDLARLGAGQELDQAERDLATARLAADQARLEREGYVQLGRARQLDEARLEVDQSRGRAEDAAAELAELEAMYAEEEFATKTKELVLNRGRRNLELSRRALELAERRLRETEGFELPKKDREHEQGELKAQKALAEAEQALEKQRLQQRIAVAKAEQEVDELARKLAKARSGATTPLGAQHLDVPATLGHEEAREALGRSLDWLLAHQNEDGSWAVGVLDGLLELGFSIESFYAWQVASNGLACLALLAAPETPAVRAALERGIGWLETTRPPKRGNDWDIDYVWGGLYGFAALAEIAQDARFRAGEWPARLARAAEPFLAILVKNQIAEGGWGYYDDPVYSQRPKWATSFSTALVLPALKAGEELGWLADRQVRARATRYVNRCALPNGAFAYDLSIIPWVGGDSINDVKGSLARIQVCHWALYSVGEPRITLDRLRQGLESFFEHHRFLDVAFMDPVPHEAYYFNSGYFYLFGHYYAARVIQLLPEEEREGWHARLRPHVVKVMRSDGASTDFLTSAYMKVAGTAFTALTLGLGLPPAARGVEPVEPAGSRR